MIINLDKYFWYTCGWWLLWTICFWGAEYISFYIPASESFGIWQIFLLETIWLLLGATMMIILIYQYKHHPSPLVEKIKNKIKKKQKSR